MPISTDWRENFGASASEESVVSRGLSVLERLIPEDTGCALHGWIDQAVLEIVAIERISMIRDRAMTYRPEQGGDSGILAEVEGKIFLLEISFQVGEAALSQYTPIQAPPQQRP